MALAIDGSVHAVNTFGGSATIALPGLTTTQANDIILLAVLNFSSGITSVTGATLGSFTRIGASTANTPPMVEYWACFAASALTGEVVTVVQTNNFDCRYDLFGVSGSNQTSITGAFEAFIGNENGAFNNTLPQNYTTTHADAMIISTAQTGFGVNPTAGSGFTAISSADAMLTQYKVLAATATESVTSSDPALAQAMAAFAVIQAAGGGSVNLDVPASPTFVVGRRTSTRGAALRWDADALPPIAAPAALPPFVQVQPFQPPNPATTNLSWCNRRAGAVALGDGGIAGTLIRFQPFGWPIQSVQPPNPNSGNLARNYTKYGALVGSISNVERVFSTAPPVLAAWWETLALPPPRPRWMRAAALEGGIEWGGEQFTVRWINAGWEVQGVQPPAVAKRYRVVVTFDGDEGTQGPFVPPVVSVNRWGSEPILPIVRYAGRRDLSFIEAIESPAPAPFLPFGWHVQPEQPPHPARERRFGPMAPTSNIEAGFVPPVAVPLAFWETSYPQPPHLRRERAAAIMPFPSIEGTFTFVPAAAPGLWESYTPQPPHPRPERGAAIMPQSPVEGRFANFQPFGWHVAPPEPHPRRERAGGIVPALALVETPLTRFIPFWMMAPPHPEPHPRREKAGSIVPPLALTEQRLQVFYPTFWQVVPPEPHPKPERGTALLRSDLLPIISFRAIIPNPNYISVGRPRIMVSLGQPRQRISAGAPRNRVVLGISNAVSQTNELLPPIDSSVEIETVTFDFGLILAPGVTITSVVSLTCQVLSGTDPNPASRLVGGAAIVPSPNTGLANQAVSQLVGTMIGGVTYRLQCVATSSDGQTISLWNHLTCQTPN